MKKSNSANLISQSNLLLSAINSSINWAENSLKDSEKISVTSALKSHRRAVRKTSIALEGKPVLALFGASQVGKSYMANNLLYNNDNLLLIHDHINGNEIDFIKSINPEGKGNEATSTVTRFTSEEVVDKSKKPVKIKLFGLKDIVLVLADSYFSDYIDQIDRYNTDQIIEHIAVFESYQVEEKQFYFTDDDVYEIKEYITKHYSKSLSEYLFALNSCKFWEKAATVIQNIPPHHWVDIFNILWNNHAPINEMFTISKIELETLNYRKEAHVDFSAILREGVNGSGQAIINVKSLSNFFEKDENIEVQLDTLQLVTIPASRLCFLTSEIVLTVSKSSIENRSFIKEADVIDFPGARSREELRDLSDQSRIYMLLRGKVSYLFNYYSSNYLTNTLFVCMRTQQTNVSTMPRLIKQWIEDNVGENEIERGINIKQVPPPLFVIFTWWNTQLQYKEKTDNINPRERIEKLFETRFQQEIIGSYDWHNSWTCKDNKSEKFRNFYLLRDFKESDFIFKSNNGTEVDFSSESQETFFHNYRTELLNYHKEKDLFFVDPILSFDEASSLNKDGSEFILKNLKEIPFESNFIDLHYNRLQNSLGTVQKILRKYYHAENEDKQYTQAIQDAAHIHMVLNRIFGINTFHFGKLMETLQINEKDIFEINHDLLRDVSLVDNSKLNEMVFYKIHSPRLILGEEMKSEENYKFNLRVLCEDYKRDSIDDTEMFFTQKGINLDHLFFGKNAIVNKSDALAEKATQFWFDKILTPERFEYFIPLGFEPSLIDKLLQNVKNNYIKNGINRIIAEHIKDYVDLGKRLDEAEDLIAHVTSSIINEFVNTMGWKYYNNEDLGRIATINKTFNLDIRFPEQKDVFVSLHKGESTDEKINVEYLLDIMDSMNERLNNSQMDPQIINNIPMIKYYNNWIELMKISFIETCDIPNYDIKLNKNLGECLKEYEPILSS